MLKLSSEARDEVAAFFANNPDVPRVLRVYVTPGTCGGPVLSITTDQADSTDTVEVVDGVTYCMDARLASRVGTVSIGVGADGLTVSAERPLMDPSAFAGCSCCGGGCGSH